MLSRQSLPVDRTLITDAGVEAEKKAKTPYDLARLRLERLTDNIHKPAPIPNPKKVRAPNKPPEFVRNVVGSSAAAGSAEFHIFRNNRRREMLRVEFLEKEAAIEDNGKAFEEKLAKRKQHEEDVTAKKRQKRLKRKQRMRELRKKGKKSKNDESESDSDLSDGARSDVSDPGTKPTDVEESNVAPTSNETDKT